MQLVHFTTEMQTPNVDTPGPQKKMSSKLYLRPRVKNTHSPSIGSLNRTGRSDLFTMATYRDIQEESLVRPITSGSK